jgi:hypothetical protein
MFWKKMPYWLRLKCRSWVCALSLTNEFTMCRGFKKIMPLYLVDRMVCLIESSESSASILQSKTNSTLFKLQHFFLCQKSTRNYKFYCQTNQIHLFLKLFILVKHSTYFGRSFRPSSGVQDRTYSNRYMVKVKQSRYRPGVAQRVPGS